MAEARVVGGLLHPLDPENYGEPERFQHMVDGLLEAGDVVRTVEHVGNKYPVVAGLPFTYDSLGAPAVFAVSDSAVEQALNNPDLVSTQGTGIIEFSDTDFGRRVKDIAAFLGDAAGRQAKRAIQYGDPLSTDGGDHQDIRSIINGSREFKGKDDPDRDMPLERYIESLADDFVGSLSSPLRAGEQVDVVELANEFTYRTIARIIGIDLTGEDAAEKIKTFMHASQQAFLVGEVPLGSAYLDDNGEVATTAHPILAEARRVLQQEHTQHDGSFLDKLRNTEFCDEIRKSAADMPQGPERASREEFVNYLELVAQEVSKIYGTVSADQFIAAKLLTILMPAGSETTSTVITRGIHALVENPEQRRLLSQAVDSGNIKPAVEEIIRYGSPVHLVGRTAARATMIAGVPISEGERVFAAVGASNRDPAKFNNPWKLQLDRDEGYSNAFGGGRHVCPGSGLARTELGILFTKLDESGILDEVTVAEPGLVDRPTPQLRTPRSLMLVAAQK